MRPSLKNNHAQRAGPRLVGIEIELKLNINLLRGKKKKEKKKTQNSHKALLHKRREDLEEADHYVKVEEMKRFKQLVFPCAQFMKRENKRDILYVEQENYVGIDEKRELDRELVDTNGDMTTLTEIWGFLT